MAQLDPPVVVDPVVAALYAADLNDYALRPPRWDVRDPTNVQPGEPLDLYLLRAALAARHWAQEDAVAAAAEVPQQGPQAAPGAPAPAAQATGAPVAKRPPGRPRVYEERPGESPDERRRRLARARALEDRLLRGRVPLSLAQLNALVAWAWAHGFEAATNGGEPMTSAQVMHKVRELDPQ